MRQLWHDIRTHPYSAVLFLLFWLAYWVAHWSLEWSGGIPPAGVSVGLLAPVMAGALVGWWRAPTREGLLLARRSLAGGPLAALLVILVDMVLLFAPSFFGAIVHGTREWAEVVVSWLGASTIMGLLALAMGWVGARVGAVLAGAVRAGALR